MVDHGSNPFKNDDTAKKHDIPPFGYYMFLDVFLIAILNAGLSPTPNGSKGSKGSKAAGMVAGDDPNIPNMLLDWDFTMLGSNGKVTNV